MCVFEARRSSGSSWKASTWCKAHVMPRYTSCILTLESQCEPIAAVTTRRLSTGVPFCWKHYYRVLGWWITTTGESSDMANFSHRSQCVKWTRESAACCKHEYGGMRRSHVMTSVHSRLAEWIRMKPLTENVVLLLSP